MSVTKQPLLDNMISFLINTTTRTVYNNTDFIKNTNHITPKYTTMNYINNIVNYSTINIGDYSTTNYLNTTTQPIHMGLFFLSETQKIIYYIIYSLLFFAGIIGNSFVMYLICSKNRKKITNFDIQIISLAIADLLASLFLPIVMVHDIVTDIKHWHLLGDFGCKVFLPMPHLNSLVSALMLIVISIERLQVIRRKKLTRRSRRTSVIEVFGVWLISILVVFPYFYVLKVEDDTCNAQWDIIYSFYYYAVVQCLSCFLPIIIMAVVYTWSALELNNKKVPGENRKLHVRRKKNNQRVTQMFGIIVVIFFLMTTPYMVSFFFIAYYGTFDKTKYLENETLLNNLQFAFYTLMAFNACIDPLVYAVRYKELSKNVKNYLSSMTKRRRKMGVSNHLDERFLRKRKNNMYKKSSDCRKVSDESNLSQEMIRF